MPGQIPSRDLLATSPFAAADSLLNGTTGDRQGWLSFFGFTFALADASVIYTVPATAPRLQIVDAFWEPTTSLTGGASSAIGLKSSNTAYATAGDILGGAAGDVAAGLTATPTAPLKRTVGAKIASGVVLVAGDTVIFNRMVSAFTAGAFNIHLKYALVPSA